MKHGGLINIPFSNRIKTFKNKQIAWGKGGKLSG